MANIEKKNRILILIAFNLCHITIMIVVWVFFLYFILVFYVYQQTERYLIIFIKQWIRVFDIKIPIIRVFIFFYYYNIALLLKVNLAAAHTSHTANIQSFFSASLKFLWTFKNIFIIIFPSNGKIYYRK